jgi:hypothetical protein
VVVEGFMSRTCRRLFCTFFGSVLVGSLVAQPPVLRDSETTEIGRIRESDPDELRILKLKLIDDLLPAAEALLSYSSNLAEALSAYDSAKIDQQKLRSVFEEGIAKIRGLVKQMLSSRGLFLISVMQSGDLKPPSVPENVTQLGRMVKELESACRAVKGTLSLQREQLGAPVVSIDRFSSSELKIPLKSQLEQLDRLAEASSKSVRKII